MCRLQPAFVDCDLIFASTDHKYYENVTDFRYFSLPDASMWNKPKLLWQALSVLVLLLRTQPDIVLTTGASVGFFGIFFGKLLRKKTIWVDSIANCDELSLSGQKIKRFADLYLTQWPHLARAEGPHYVGSVI